MFDWGVFWNVVIFGMIGGVSLGACVSIYYDIKHMDNW